MTFVYCVWLLCWSLASLTQAAAVQPAPAGHTSYGNSSAPTQTASDDSTTTIHLTSTIKSTITVPPSASGTCGGDCSYGPADSHTWDWPDIQKTTMVVATLVYKVNNATNTTSTLTRYNNATLENGYTTLDDAAWSQILHTTGVHVVDGTPTLPFTTPAKTDLTGTVLVTTTIVSPTGYLNFGWLYEEQTAVKVLGSAGSTCSGTTITGVLTPTAIPADCTADSAYKCPNGGDVWDDLLPESVKKSCTPLNPVAPLTGILSVSALTATTTEFDSFVHDNTTPNPPKTTAGGEKPTTNNPPAPTTATQRPPSSPPAQSPPAQSPPAQSPPAQSPPAQSPPVQSPPAQSPPAQSPPVQSPAQSPAPASPGSPSQGNTGNGNNPAPPTQPAPAPGTTVPVITIGGSTVPVAGTTPVTIGGQPLTPGGSPITVSGTVISLPAPSPGAPNGQPASVVVGGSTQGLGSIIIGGISPGATPPPGSSPPGIVVGGQTLTPGAPASTISGTPISVNPSGSIIVGGTSTLAPGASSIPIGNGGSIPISSIPGSAKAPVVVAGTTITPGAPAVTISGTPVSVAPGGTSVIVGGSTLAPGATAVIGGQTVTLGSSAGSSPVTTGSAVVIAGQTLLPGGPAITVSGTTYSLPTESSGAPAQIVVDGTTVTAGASGITVNGTPVSLSVGASATGLVEGSSTIPVSAGPSVSYSGPMQSANAAAAQGFETKVVGVLVAGLVGCLGML
ncbi:MAG: hypothetical protein Q9227_008048 [Pyrenula ochraceoflavens]